MLKQRNTGNFDLLHSARLFGDDQSPRHRNNAGPPADHSALIYENVLLRENLETVLKKAGWQQNSYDLKCQELRETEAKLNDNLKALELSTTNISDLLEQKRADKKEISNLTRRLQHMELNESIGAEAEAVEKAATHQRLKELEIETHTMRTHYHTTVEDLQDSVRKNDIIMKEQAERLEKLQSENTNLNTVVKNQGEMFIDMRVQRNAHKRKIDLMESEIDHLKRVLQETHVNLRETLSKYEDSQWVLSELEEERDKAKENLDQYKKEHDNLEAQLNADLAEARRKLASVIETTEQMKADHAEQVSTLMSIRAGLTRDLAEESDQNAKLSNDLSDTQSVLSNLEKVEEDLRKEHKELKQHSQKYIAELELTKSHISAQNTSLSHKLSIAEERIKELETENSDLHKNVREHTITIKELEAQSQTLGYDLFTARKDCEELQIELRSTKSECEKQLKGMGIKAKENEIRQVQWELKKEKDRVREKEAELKLIDRQMETLRCSNAELKEELARMQHKLDEKG